jgi:hypothetical protein
MCELVKKGVVVAALVHIVAMHDAGAGEQDKRTLINRPLPCLPSLRDWRFGRQPESPPQYDHLLHH